jgi:hypothetical protein
MKLKDILTYGTLLAMTGTFGCGLGQSYSLKGEIKEENYKERSGFLEIEEYTFLMDNIKYFVSGKEARDFDLLLDKGDTVEFIIREGGIKPIIDGLITYEILSINGKNLSRKVSGTSTKKPEIFFQK